MGNRAARFTSTLVASIVAGAPLAAISQTAPSELNPANAVGDCLASPKGTAPQGQHWHYRLERSTRRQCWYLRAEGGKAAQRSAQAAIDPPAADSTAPQPHQVQDARAEYAAPQTVAAPSATAQAASTAPAAAPPSPSASETNAQQPAIWPDAPAMAAPPAAQPLAPPATAAAEPSAIPAKSSAPVMHLAADVPADSPTGSLQMLLLVVGGALALAGVLASVIYRFAGSRARVQAGDRRVNWNKREPHDHGDSRAPWINAAPAPAPRAERPRAVDFDAARPQAARLAAFSNEIARIAAQAPSTHVEAAEPDETEIEYFNEEFEIETSAPQLATNETRDKVPPDHDKDAHTEVAVDIDIITAMLERLAKEGPRLSRSAISQADYADPARSLQGRPGVRA